MRGFGSEIKRGKFKRTQRVASEPPWVKLDTISTDIGRSRINRAKEIKAVHLGHLDIECDRVRIELIDQPARTIRVDDLAQELADHR